MEKWEIGPLSSSKILASFLGLDLPIPNIRGKNSDSHTEYKPLPFLCGVGRHTLYMWQFTQWNIGVEFISFGSAVGDVEEFAVVCGADEF